MFNFTRLPSGTLFLSFFPISSSLDILIILLTNEGKKQCFPNNRIVEALPRRRGTKHFSYHLYTCENPFIHLLGSSLVQWMMVRFSGREEPKHDLQVRLGEASLCLGGEVCLGGACYA